MKIHKAIYLHISSPGVINEVLYVPGLGTNLFSIGSATKTGSEVYFVNEMVTFVRDGRIEIQGQRVGSTLYHLNLLAKEAIQTSTALAVKPTETLITWHERFAHLNCKEILKMASSGCLIGLDLAETSEQPTTQCEGCILGKMHRLPFKTGRNRASEVYI